MILPFIPQQDKNAPMEWRSFWVTTHSPVLDAAFSEDSDYVVTTDKEFTKVFAVETGLQAKVAVPAVSPGIYLSNWDNDVQKAVEAYGPEHKDLSSTRISEWPKLKDAMFKWRRAYSRVGDTWLFATQRLRDDSPATTLEVWQDKKKRLARFDKVLHVVPGFSHDGKRVYACVVDEKGSAIVDLATRRKVREFATPAAFPYDGMMVSDDGERVVLVNPITSFALYLRTTDTDAPVAMTNITPSRLSPDLRHALRYSGSKEPSFYLEDYKVWLRNLPGKPDTDGFGNGGVLFDPQISINMGPVLQAAAVTERAMTEPLDAFEQKIIQGAKEKDVSFVAKRVGYARSKTNDMDFATMVAPEFTLDAGSYIVFVHIAGEKEKFTFGLRQVMTNGAIEEIMQSTTQEVGPIQSTAQLSFSIPGDGKIRIVVDGPPYKKFGALLMKLSRKPTTPR